MGSVFSVVAVVERFVCGPLDEETVFEKRGEEADGAVDKKMIEQSHFVTRCSINILSVTKYFEEIVHNCVNSIEFAHNYNKLTY